MSPRLLHQDICHRHFRLHALERRKLLTSWKRDTAASEYEKCLPRDAHSDVGMSRTLQLLLEFGTRITKNEYRDHPGCGLMAERLPE
jgi:hypothetical protein